MSVFKFICPGNDMVDSSPEGYLHQFEELGTACMAYRVTFEPTVHGILQAWAVSLVWHMFDVLSSSSKLSESFQIVAETLLAGS